MKKFRRISTLALVIVLVCAFSASAFADSYGCTRDIPLGSDTMSIYTELSRYEAYCDVGLTTGDLIGNYISIDIDTSYYASESGFHNNQMFYDMDTYAEVSDDTFCSARFNANNNLNIYWIYRAVYTCYASTNYGANTSGNDVYTLLNP